MKTVKVKTDESVAELLGLLKGKRSLQTIVRYLVAGVNLGSEILQGQIVKERFTGQGPFPVSRMKLGVVSGRLRRSIRFGKAKVAGAGRLVVEAGSNVKYFGRHEFGGGGRQVRVGAAKVKSYKVPNAFGKGKTLTVAAHTRQAYSKKDTTPARKPLQAGIKEHAARVYGVQIEKQLIRALEGGIA